MEDDRAGYQAAPAANATDDLLPVAEAAAAAGVPLRTIYSWIKQKKIPSVQRAGRRLVSVAELRALRGDAAASSAGTAPANGSTGSGSTLRTAPRPQSPTDGVLEGRIASMLDDGFDESLIVQQLQVPFAKVLAVAAAWRSARQSHVIATRLDVVEERVDTLGDRMSAAEAALVVLHEHIESQTAVLAELQQLVAAMARSWYGTPVALARPVAPLQWPP